MALVIVLCFLLLATGVIVAFLSFASSDRKNSDAYSSQIYTEMLAAGALETLLGDLKQEIAAGSIATQVPVSSGTIIVYRPGSPATAVPALSGTNAMGSAPANLVKRSAAGQPFFPASGSHYNFSNNTVTQSGTTTTAYPPGGGTTGRAAAVSSTAPSLNGRFISLARWNKPLLLPKAVATSTDLTPKTTGADGFVAPDWVLVARDGSNPVQWGNGLKVLGSNPVIGRYAYCVYNEGGLLDINLAGYATQSASSSVPLGMSESESRQKRTVGMADLTQLGLTQKQVNEMVTWRNSATLGQSGTDAYLRMLTSNTSGFLKVNVTGTGQGAPTDNAFLSRQSLLKFVLTQLDDGSPATLADRQNAVQYLGSFSRDLNQPSYAPDPARPRIVNYSTSGNYQGGNNQYQLDDLANPAFASVRVSRSFTRNDGTAAELGEALVKKRFPLNRLAWITCKGPSAGRASSGDPDIEALKQAGITEEWLAAGDAAAIRKYFGLEWDDAEKRWSYSHGDPGKGICCLPELVNGQVDPKRGSGSISGAPREPDFFEMIKAAINVGSLAKASFASRPVTKGYQALRDANVNEQLIQIGANIIDQFDADGYPTRIWFAGATGSGHEFRGVEDLPYIYRVRTHVVQLAAPVPNVPGPRKYNIADNTVEISGTASLPFISTGTAACILLPEIWNPHDGSRPLPAMMPSEFHFTTDTTDPDKNYAYCKVYTSSRASSGTSTFVDSDDPGALANPPFDPDLFKASARQSPLYGSGPNQNNDLQFNVNHPHQFREPTALFIPGLPAGSNLRYGSKDWVVGGASFGAKTPVLPLNPEKTAMLEAGSNNPYLGVCIGVAPLAWIASVSGSYAYVRTINTSPRSEMVGGEAITHQLWYLDPFGTLRLYDEKYSGYSGLGNFSGQKGMGWPAGDTQPGVIGTPRLGVQGGNLMVFTDPRTRRWGPGMDNGSYSCPMIRQSATLPYPVPSPVCLPWRLNETGPGQFFTVAAAPYYPYDTTGWYPATSSMANNYLLAGLLSQNNPAAPIGIQAPLTAWRDKSYFYCDPDGVARRAMGGYVPFSSSTPATTPVGLPNVAASVVDPVTALCAPASSLVTYTPATGVSGFSLTVHPGQNLGRPIILNRPFKTVGELAYTFSDTPWRNLDLANPESGNTALLDIFCIDDNTGSDAITAGKVDLNTRQVPVIKALLAGAAKDENGAATVTSSDVDRLANALVFRTSGTNLAAGQGALVSPAELVGRYVGGTVSVSTGTGAIYRGFGEDLSLDGPAPLPANVTTIHRFREAPLRALSSVGTTRSWNLLIDLVAQRGRYPTTANNLEGFFVEGEKRLWIHVAVDRATGEILDKQVEVISE